MAAQGGAGSTLSALAQKRRTIEKTRQALGLSSAPAGGAGSVRPPAPPPTPKAIQSSAQTTTPVAQPDAAGNTPPVERDPAMLEMAKQHLDEIKNQGNQVAPAPPPIMSAPPTMSAPLPDLIQDVGAAGYSPEMQFMRLTGRAPSGREMVVFNATHQLTQQLGRPPTRNEVLMHVSNPVDLGQSGPAPVSG